MEKLESLTIVFPAYNEEENIEKVIKDALRIFPNYAKEIEIIAVNDGSRDRTGEIIEELSNRYPEVKAIHHKENKGYGAALKSGFYNAKGEYVFFTDSDNQFDLEDFRVLFPYIKDFDLVIGYRIKRRDPFYRIVNAKLYNLLIRIIFGLKVKDINCAFKVMKRSIFDSIKLESDGALINAELLIKSLNKGYRIKEVGVRHFPCVHGEQTGAKPSVIFKMFFELFHQLKKLKKLK